MTIRFAAAVRGENPIIARILGASVHLRPCNDNYNGIAGDKLMRATLRHFAQHGLGAARRAKENAEIAWLSEDCESYAFWLSVCRALDRRMADSLPPALPALDAADANPFGNFG